MSVLGERRAATRSRLDEFCRALPSSEQLAGDGRACVYATGSFARGEASPFSDLDLFIVGECEVVKDPDEGEERSRRVLARLNEIRIKSELIVATEKLDIQSFSGDGQYLAFYTVDDLVASLGHPSDDATNTFTARLLLLLESTPIVGADIYEKTIRAVIDPYWRDFDDHPGAFMPAFLANDVMRLWRTFCVNYEARTRTDHPTKKAKRKLKNYKLKHSRMLTCYSALLYLLATHRSRRTVTRDDAAIMARLTPTQRLEWLCREMPSVAPVVDALLQRYVKFLEQTNVAENDLVQRFMIPDESKVLLEDSYEFGDALYELLVKVGAEGADSATARFYRLLVV